MSAMLGSGSRLIGSQLALVWIQVSHLFVARLVGTLGPSSGQGPALLTTLLVLRHVQFHYSHVCAINFIRSAADPGVIELWPGQMMENRAVKLF